MIAVLPDAVLRRHERENTALAHVLRERARGLLGEINRERGEGYLYLSECLAAGFFMLFERMPSLTRDQAPDLSRQVMLCPADLDGYARLVLRLEEMKGVNV